MRIPLLLPGMFDWRERRVIDRLRHDRRALEVYMAHWESCCEERARKNGAPRIHWSAPIWRNIGGPKGPVWMWTDAKAEGYIPMEVLEGIKDWRRFNAALRARYIRGDTIEEATKWAPRKYREVVRKLLPYVDKYLRDGIAKEEAA